MRQLIYITLIIFAFSCEISLNKEMYLANFQEFILTVEQKALKVEDEDWKSFNETFDYYSKTEFNRFEGQLTEEELQMIDLLIGKYVGLKVKYEANKAANWLERKANQGTGFIDELFE